MHLAPDANSAPLEGIIPYLPTIGLVLCSLIVAAYTVWNRRRGAVETKAPTVSEIWAREERVSARLRWLEGFVPKLAAAFRAYIGRVQSGGSTDLTDFERKTLETDISDVDP